MKGEKAGSTEVLADNLPGMPDNIRLSSSPSSSSSSLSSNSIKFFAIITHLYQIKRQWQLLYWALPPNSRCLHCVQTHCVQTTGFYTLQEANIVNAGKPHIIEVLGPHNWVRKFLSRLVGMVRFLLGNRNQHHHFHSGYAAS